MNNEWKQEAYKLTREFLNAMGKSGPPWFREVKESDALLVDKLLGEEYDEFLSAIEDKDPVAALDGLVDMLAIVNNGFVLLAITPRGYRPNDRNALLQDAAILEHRLKFLRPLCEDECSKALNNMADNLLEQIDRFSHDAMGAIREVARANMTKLWSAAELQSMPAGATSRPSVNGKFVVYREDGKIIKPPSFTAPNLAPFVRGAVRPQSSEPPRSSAA